MGTRRQLSRSSDADTSGYDARRGDPEARHASRGNFSIAITSCLANDWAATSIPWTDATGGDPWFLVRGIDRSATATRDSLDPLELRSRDVGIAMYPATCP